MKDILINTGPKGSGKTTAWARWMPAREFDQTVVFDTEDSYSDVLAGNKDLGFDYGLYIRAYERFRVGDDALSLMAQNKLPWVTDKQRGALVQYWDWFVKTVNERVTPGRFRHFIIDTIEPIEAAMTAWAEANPKSSGWSGVRAYGRLESEAVRPLYENFFEALAQRGIEHIYLTSHLKRVWEDDKPILNKVQMGGRLALLSRISSAMYWLIGNANPDGAPAAIVLKARHGSHSLDADGYVTTRRVLPPRIPHFTKRDLLAYEREPADLANPKPGEALSAVEIEMISEFLTDEQMRLMVLNAEIDLATKREVETGEMPKSIGAWVPSTIAKSDAPPVDGDPQAKAKEMKAEGKPAPLIAKATGLTVEEVKAL